MGALRSIGRALKGVLITLLWMTAVAVYFLGIGEALEGPSFWKDAGIFLLFWGLVLATYKLTQD